MISSLMQKKKENLEKELEEIKQKEKDFQEQDTFKLKTNTAYIQNQKMFLGWEDFLEWVQIKHQQHWDKINDSILEVTFKIKRFKSKPSQKTENSKTDSEAEDGK